MDVVHCTTILCYAHVIDFIPFVKNSHLIVFGSHDEPSLELNSVLLLFVTWARDFNFGSHSLLYCNKCNNTYNRTGGINGINEGWNVFGEHKWGWEETPFSYHMTFAANYLLIPFKSIPLNYEFYQTKSISSFQWQFVDNSEFYIIRSWRWWMAKFYI